MGKKTTAEVVFDLYTLEHGAVEVVARKDGWPLLHKVWPSFQEAAAAVQELADDLRTNMGYDTTINQHGPLVAKPQAGSTVSSNENPCPADAGCPTQKRRCGDGEEEDRDDDPED